MSCDEQRLLEAIRAIDRARSLSDILDALASSAAREASRVGILLVRGDALRGWRLAGFGDPVDTALDLDVPLHDGVGVIGEALRTGVAASSTTAGGPTLAPFDLAEGRERIAVPIPVSGQVVAVLYADQGLQDDPRLDHSTGWPATLEVMARHAARCLEAVTAFAAARALTKRADVDSVASASTDGAGESSDPQNDENEGARRFARLLVSEIKLYHEAAVLTGQRERDLATRLGDQIARARVLYEQRVPAPLRRLTDHFHAELVRTLANGDAGMLGQSEGRS